LNFLFNEFLFKLSMNNSFILQEILRKLDSETFLRLSRDPQFYLICLTSSLLIGRLLREAVLSDLPRLLTCKQIKLQAEHPQWMMDRFESDYRNQYPDQNLKLFPPLPAPPNSNQAQYHLDQLTNSSYHDLCLLQSRPICIYLTWDKLTPALIQELTKYFPLFVPTETLLFMYLGQDRDQPIFKINWSDGEVQLSYGEAKFMFDLLQDTDLEWSTC